MERKKVNPETEYQHHFKSVDPYKVKFPKADRIAYIRDWCLFILALVLLGILIYAAAN